MRKIMKGLIIAVIAVIGFVVTSCDNGNSPCSHTGACTTAQTCTKCGDIIAALGHDHSSSLVCKRTGCDHQYALGDTGPAGGIIFYVAPEGFKLYQGTNDDVELDTYTTAYYLEAWTDNEPGSGSIRWSYADQTTESKPPPYVTTDVPLVQQIHDTSAPTQWIGYGLRNTRLIINAMDAMTPPNNEDSLRGDRAVHVAITEKGGHNDWFLPSIDELNVMSIARAAPNNIEGLPAGSVWSSSQRTSDTVFHQNISTGVIGAAGSGNKFTNGSVRAVRAF